MIKLCVNGSRGFNDPAYLDRNIRSIIHTGQERNFKLIVGGARGADTLAKEWAIKNNVDYIEIKAEWNRLGKAAGFVRNKIMIDQSDMLLSFWDGSSKGTKHTIDYAKDKGIPVQVCYYNKKPLLD